MALLVPGPAATAHDSVARPAQDALNAVIRVWNDEIDELTAVARQLAAAGDTYEFVARPNIPYVDTHYGPEQLAADRIDTVLIVNRAGKPVFWRRLNHGPGRGFADAKAFLAELPRLPAPGAAGVASFAGVATLAQGTSLVVAMPIHATAGTGGARGWLIAARPFDATPLSRLEEAAHIPVQLLDPGASAADGDIELALREPLTPIVRTDDTHIRGVMAVTDLRGAPFRVFGVSLARPPLLAQPAPAGGAPQPPAASGRSTLWPNLAAVFGCVAVVVILGAILRVRRRNTTRVRLAAHPTGANPARDGEQPNRGLQPNRGVQPETEAAPLFPREPAPPSAPLGFNAPQARERLHARMAAINAVFRYQPQIDLQTGRVSGVEALLCASGMSEGRPATEFVAEIEATGLGLTLFERWLQEACREQRLWLGKVGHDFPLGIPVSQRTILNRGFLPLVRRVLLENDLAPEFLELEVPETALGASANTLRALREAHEAGISIAIDGFNAAKSNLRLLTLVPIAKLRIDPFLVRNLGGGAPEALLFDGILGAARGLGIAVCVTGVNSEKSLAAILRHGRPLAQGMALGAPVDSERFLQLLRGSCVDTASVRPLVLDDVPLQTEDGNDAQSFS